MRPAHAAPGSDGRLAEVLQTWPQLQGEPLPLALYGLKTVPASWRG